MHSDQSLFGEGPYPLTGPLAILARVAFVAALLAIVVAVFLPSHLVPQFVRSHHLQHFAAYYVVTLLGLAASARSSVATVVTRIALFCTVLEASHLVAGAALDLLVDNWVADLGGIAAALAPLWIAAFRRRFRAGPS